MRVGAAMLSRIKSSRSLHREQRFLIGITMISWVRFRRLFWTESALLYIVLLLVGCAVGTTGVVDVLQIYRCCKTVVCGG